MDFSKIENGQRAGGGINLESNERRLRTKCLKPSLIIVSNRFSQRVFHNGASLIQFTGVKVNTGAGITVAIHIPGHCVIDDRQAVTEKVSIILFGKRCGVSSPRAMTTRLFQNTEPESMSTSTQDTKTWPKHAGPLTNASRKTKKRGALDKGGAVLFRGVGWFDGL